MTEIYVKVEPDSKGFRVEKGSMYRFYLENEAEHGKANQELVKRVEEITGEKPAIISGHSSGRKKLKIPLAEEEFREAMEEYRNG
ncbi:MAG: DUF167 family protein [Candidatus Nanohaloarchaea archaeon]